MSRLLYLCRLAARSAWNRKTTLILIVVCIALSTSLLLGLERIRAQARSSFTQAISGTDLVVGARGSGIQLLLYAVFHQGGATNNIGWNTAGHIAELPDVAWTIPVALGDTHRGYPVVATTGAFFEHYRYLRDRGLTFAQGRPFQDLFDVVVGAEVARKAGYGPGSSLTLTHGSGVLTHNEHADKPFVVTGVLTPTGTPVDRSLYIGLEAMEAIHVDWKGGAPVPGFSVSAEQVGKFDLTPKSVTAVLVGLKSRSRVFAVQRSLNTYRGEALTAVLPGVALDQLWDILRTGEEALVLVSWLVTLTGLAGMVSAMLAGLGERRRELAILRASGASPRDILFLMCAEGLLLLILGMAAGLALLAAAIHAAGPTLIEQYGIRVHLGPPTLRELQLAGAILAAGLLTSLIPALRAYRLSLADGLSAST